LRKLASIQTIDNLQPIEGADKIELATVLGWKVVVQKGLHEVGNKVVYCEIDCKMPETPEFEFLRPRGFRIKTIRLRGQLSQGICFPLADFGIEPEIEVGTDVTERLGITKWEPQIPACLAGDARGGFPGFVPKTDEIRLQSCPEVLKELRDANYYITTKLDGTSATFCSRDGDVQVCSRNLSLKESETNTFWRMFHKYKMGDIFSTYDNLAIQGEICGPGIQKNPLGLKDFEFFVFDVFDILTGKYYNLDPLLDFCEETGLQMVPIESGACGGPADAGPVELWLLKAQGYYYPSGIRKEGIVVRAMDQRYSPTLGKRLSFKVINNEYLLKNEE